MWMCMTYKQKLACILWFVAELDCSNSIFHGIANHMPQYDIWTTSRCHCLKQLNECIYVGTMIVQHNCSQLSYPQILIPSLKASIHSSISAFDLARKYNTSASSPTLVNHSKNQILRLKGCMPTKWKPFIQLKHYWVVWSHMVLLVCKMCMDDQWISSLWNRVCIWIYIYIYIYKVAHCAGYISDNTTQALHICKMTEKQC